MRGVEDLVSVVETWQGERKGLADRFEQDSLRRFAEVHNARTKQMISLLQKTDPDFYSALLELAQHAQSMTTAGTKFFVNKVDRTNV